METLKNKKYETADYLSRYTPFPYYYDTLAERDVYGIGANVSKDCQWTAHKVKATDTLDNLALTYYSNPSYWWLIAYFNDIADSLEPIVNKYEIIKIPTLSGITFTDLR